MEKIEVDYSIVDSATNQVLAMEKTDDMFNTGIVVPVDAFRVIKNSDGTTNKELVKYDLPFEYNYNQLTWKPDETKFERIISKEV